MAVSRKTAIDVLFRNIATIGFIGYVPFAPGTFGTMAAFSLFILLKPSLSVHLAFLFLAIPLGVISSGRAEMLLHDRDSKHIVIDEFCGYLLSVLFIPFSLASSLTAFFLFRFFDILKPFPIKKIESLLKGGKGIMADDIVAALFTNLMIQIWNRFW